jgi:hypothetical protein
MRPMHMKIKIAIVTILVLAAVGVGWMYQTGRLGIVNPDNRLAEQPIPDDVFVRAYVELAVLAESTPIGTPEYEREKKRVLEGVGVTPAAVEKQLASYNDRPDLWHPIWEKIQTELQKRSAETSNPGG